MLSPTKDNLQKRKIEVNPTCIFCGKEETASYLFQNCEVVKRIWKSSVLGMIVPSCPTMNISSWFESTSLYLYQAGNNMYQIWPNLVSTVSAIRIHRNNAIFRNQRIYPQEVLALESTEFARWHKGFCEDTKKAGVERQDPNEEREPLSWKWGTAISRMKMSC
ncbi:Immunoglobulin-binding protein 1 [Bienertia sinuspersici]